MIGLAGGESRQVTAAAQGVSDFSWSPDGKCLVICAGVDPGAPEDPQPGSAPPQVRVVQRIRYRYDGLGWRGNLHTHLFTVTLDAPSPQAGVQLTDGDWDDLAPVWSPDGSWIAFLSDRRDDRDIRDLEQVYVIPADGGPAVGWSGGLTDAGLTNAGALAWSPDSKRLLAVGSQETNGLVLWQGWLYVLEPGREPRRITDDSIKPSLTMPALARPTELGWGQDGTIRFLGEQRGESFLFQVAADGGAAVSGYGGNCQISSLSLDRSMERAVVATASPGSPGDLYLVDLARGDQQATDRSQPAVPGGTSSGAAGEIRRSPGRVGHPVPVVGFRRISTPPVGIPWSWTYTAVPTARFTTRLFPSSRSLPEAATLSWRSTRGVRPPMGMTL